MSKANKKANSFRLTSLGILTALVIVLQIFTTFVHFGPFSITLALIPIVVGAAMFGPGAGAYLGAVFSVIVVIMSALGGDPGGFMVWSANPIMCIVLCMAKGTFAGFEAGVHYRALESKNKIVASVTAAIVSPIVNTGIFVLGMMIFFKDTLAVWANGTDIILYIIFGLTGINFLIELGVNIVLSPVVVQIVDAGRKTKLGNAE